MIILIDGYNVIRHLFVHHDDERDAQRDWFLRRMAQYLAHKQRGITQLMVVFDGGLFGHRQREIVAGVVVLYAGRGHSADDVLVEYAEKFKKQAAVVTNDRELQHRCQVHDSQVMKVSDFNELVIKVCEESGVIDATIKFGQVVVQKYEDGQEADSVLDDLMLAGSVQAVHKPGTKGKVKASELASRKKKNKTERRAQQLKRRLG